MKTILSTLFGALLGATLLFPWTSVHAATGPSAAPSSPAAVADAVDPGPANSPRAGTAAEEADYALREAASPEVQEFTGGETVVISVSLLAILLIVIIVILLSGD